LLSLEAFHDVKWIVERLGLKSLHDGALKVMLKAISEAYFKMHDLLPHGKSWRVWVGTDTFFGSASTKLPGVDEAIVEDLEEWTNPTPAEHPQWDDRRALIKRGMELTRNRNMRFTKKGWNVDGFIGRMSEWIANGASSGPGLDGTRKTKASMLLQRGCDGIRQMLFDNSDLSYTTYIKSERKKNRATVAAGDSVWLQMCFVFPGLSDAVASVFPSSLKGGVKLDQWLTWCRRLKGGKNVAMPIDQSKFDHIPTKEEVHDAVFDLREKARSMAGWTVEQELVSEILLTRLKHGGTISFKKSSGMWTGPVHHGILSGWWMTAALDTYFNGAEYLAICERARVIPRLDDDEMCFQGDDVNKVGGNYAENCAIAGEYQKVLNVHPSKFWISTKCGEYLRNVFWWDHNNDRPCRSGYLARSVPSMLYAQRWTSGMMSARSIVDSWSSLASRSGNSVLCSELCVEDLLGFFGQGTSRSDIQDWLRTPTAIGGAGVLPHHGGRLLQCTEEERGLDKNEYEKGLTRTEFSDLPASARAMAIASGHQISAILPGNQAARECVDTLVGATHLKGGKNTVRQVLGPARDLGNMSVRSKPGVPSRPQFDMDPMFHTPLLRARIQDKDLDGVCDLFEVYEADRIRHFHRTWSRSVWIRWLMDKLPSGVPTTFGYATDVAKKCASLMRWPLGRVTPSAINACAASCVAEGRRVLQASFGLHGMAA
jgi:hypothetical protein